MCSDLVAEHKPTKYEKSTRSGSLPTLLLRTVLVETPATDRAHALGRDDGRDYGSCPNE